MPDGWARQKNASAARHASKATVNMQAQGTGGISVSFVSLPDGASVAGQRVLDLGTVSYSKISRTANVQVHTLADHFVVSTKVGLVVQDATHHFATATLLASLAYPD